MNSLFFRQQFVVVLSLICILFLPFILFFVEYIFVERQWKKLLTIYKKNKIIIQSIVWFPVLEEIIFLFLFINTVSYLISVISSIYY